MTRITTALKNAIVKNALSKSGVTARLEAVKANRLDWAERARVHSLGGPEKDAEYRKINEESRKAYEALPPGIRQNSTIVRTNSRLYLNLAGLSIEYRFDDLRIMSSCREVITADSPLCQEFHDLASEEEAACAQGTVVEAQVRATLDKFGTVKRLLEAWPEVLELLPAASVSAKPNLPAIQVDDLNKLVGLPGGAK